MSKSMSLMVNSEIGELEGVIVHKPGMEIENMTPENAERALYSDILNLSIASREHSQLHGVLSKICNVYDPKDLLADIFKNDAIKNNLIDTIIKNEQNPVLKKSAFSIDEPQKLATQIFEGIPMEKDTLTGFLDKSRYVLRPLHNFFFTRDASMTVFDNVIIGKMANKVRERESIIMKAIFDFHPAFSTKTFTLKSEINNNRTMLEGGDLLVAADNILIIGMGSRTTSQAIDILIDKYKSKSYEKDFHIIVQELPEEPESFIHLDMVFTLLDKDKCMIYDPVIFSHSKYQTVQIILSGGKVSSIQYRSSIVKALSSIGMEMEPLYCGGREDLWIKKREQWHSGANFFAIAPGKIIGYERNVHTINELNKNGFEIIAADDVIEDKVNPADYSKCVITIEGSELSRGGGGCRCMTMPIKRKPVEY